VTLLRDLTDDGDFADAGETQTLGTAAGSGCDVAAGSGLLAVAYRDGAGSLVLAVDRNDDGDFADADESFPIATGAETDRLAVALSGTGRVFAASGEIPKTRIFSVP
jgi:hypothetical protein